MVFRDMDYLDEIEMKAFADDSSDQQKSEAGKNNNDDYGDLG